MSTMTIGQVARQAGVGVETVRFYERQGLLEEPPRRASGYREYDEDAVAHLRFIQRAKRLGFTLKEVKELLSLWRHASALDSDVKRRAAAKIRDIEVKIKALQKMKRALVKLTNACTHHGARGRCLLLESLGRDNELDGILTTGDQ